MSFVLDGTGLSFGAAAVTGGVVKVSVVAWSAQPTFMPGDEWVVVLSGPSATDPKARAAIPMIQIEAP
jgi:hypothetical protein